MKLYEELQWRGLIQDITSPDLIDKLNEGGMTFYIGTDPTADSLHLGHYSSFLITKRLANAGHTPIMLVGGATALVGDPRGTKERDLSDREEVEKNFVKLKEQLQSIFPYEVVNNYDWTKDISIIDFLRDYGKYINVGYMLGKDLIRRQLESTGISFAEFSYTLLQGMDFKYLHENRGVDLQVAGSDQWGNITTGIELIKKTTGDEVYALTMPLVVDGQGRKFGKSEGNAVWLDAEKTTPYELYQFLINSEDSMVIDYLKRLTFLSKEEIEELEKQHLEAPERRIAHEALAREIITDLHGADAFEQAKMISKQLFSGKIADIEPSLLLRILKDVPHSEVHEGTLLEALVEGKICSSKRDAREMINGGAITINGVQVKDLDYTINKDMVLMNNEFVVRRGKKKYYVVTIL